MSVDVHATPVVREQRKRRSPAVRADAYRTSPRSRAFDAIWIIALLGFLGVVLPVMLASHYGAMGIPRSDDWSYLLTLFRWVDSGELSFNGWVSMTLVGQIAIAAPVAAIAGRSITTIQLFTSMMGLVGLLGVVFIGRQTVRPLWWAVFVAATIAAGPLWGPLAPTFMTDIPTFTLEMLTLAAAAVAFRRRPVSLPWFAISIVLGFVGVSIRQYAAIPVIAVVLVAVCMLVIDREWKRLWVVLAISGAFAVAAMAILYWWSGLPDSKSLSPTTPTLPLVRGMFIKNAGFLRLAGLLLAPVVVLAGPVIVVRRAWAASRGLTTLLTASMVVWLTATYLRIPSRPFLGNYVSRDGVLSSDVLAGNRPDVIPSEIFNLLVVVASICGILIVLTAVPFIVDLPRRVREREVPELRDPLVAVMGLTVTGFAIAYTVAILTGLPVFDRYGLPLLPLIALLVLHATRREPVAVTTRKPRTIWAFVAVGALAILGVSYTADSASFDATRWKVAEMATSAGYAPIQVGGGFEWLGYHREYGPQFRWEGASANEKKLGFPLPCVTLVINPKVGSRLVVAQAESSAFSRRSVMIVAHRNRLPCARSSGNR